MLDPFTSRCLIYENRPFGCRTHFCAAAGGPYARKDVVHLIHRLQEIDERLGGDGAASPIEDAVAGALQACQ
jgi:Fe-S-cluster containining protein